MLAFKPQSSLSRIILGVAVIGVIAGGQVGPPLPVAPYLLFILCFQNLENVSI
jgi:hypothetical protein